MGGGFKTRAIFSPIPSALRGIPVPLPLFALALAPQLRRNRAAALKSPADSLLDRRVDSLLVLAGVAGT